MWYKQINIRFVKQDEVWKKNKSLSTSYDKDEDTTGIDKGNF